MNEKTLLTATSLVTILLFTIHQADDLVRGMSPGGLLNLVVIAICSHLALRDSDACWAKVGLHNCPCFFAHDVGHPSPPHDGAGNGLRDDSKQRAFVRLDSAGRRRDLSIFGCSFGTRTVKPASPTSQVGASNQSMKPTSPRRNRISVIATTPCRGLSLSS